MISKYLPRAREIRDPQVTVKTMVAGAVVAQALGDRAAVVKLMDEAISATDAWDVRYWALPEGARVLARARALDVAERLVEGDGEEPAFPSTKAAVAFGRAAIAEARGQPELALPLYHTASDWYSSRGSVINDAHSVLGIARCEIAMGSTEEGARRIEQVRQFFAGIGATALLAEIDEATTVPGRARASSG
jgi:hypothetical protein